MAQRLVFIESGKVLGHVQVIDGELVGKNVMKSVVRSRMQRDQISAEEAIVALDGWSNGYLTTKVENV